MMSLIGIYWGFLLLMMIFLQVNCIISTETASEIHNNHTLQFFGNSFSFDSFQLLQSKFDETFSNGKFVNSWELEGVTYKPLFWYPCIHDEHLYWKRLVTWIWGTCYDSNYNRGKIWSWKPSIGDGKLHSWSPEKMCTIMNGRNLAFVGDSLSRSAFFTFVSAMYRDLMIPSNKYADKDYIKQKRKRLQETCNNGSQPTGIDKFYNVHIDCGIYPSFQVLFFESWLLLEFQVIIEAFAKQNVSLVILNSGAHTRPTTELLSQIDNFLDLLYHTIPQVSVIIRTTPPGTPFCTKYFHGSPISDGLNPAYYEKGNYNYYSFLNISEEVSQFIQQKYVSNHYPILILNVQNITSNRVDSHPGHGDCLHYCIPGPINDWNDLLFHMLMTIELSNKTDSDSYSSSRFMKRTKEYDYLSYHSYSEYFRFAPRFTQEVTKHNRNHDQKSFLFNIVEPLFYPFKLKKAGVIIIPTVAKFPAVVVEQDRRINRSELMIGNPSYYLYFNGSRHYLPESLIRRQQQKRNIFHQEAVVAMDMWDFVSIPIGKSLSEDAFLKLKKDKLITV